LIIAITNRGEFTLRMRSDKKVKLTSSLKEARDKVLMVIKTQSTAIESDFKLMSAARYKEVYGKTPQQAGVETTKKMCDGVLTEVVLFRELAEGEWKMKIRDESAARQQEIIDNGKSLIRNSQQDTVFKSLANAATSALSVKVVLPTEVGDQPGNNMRCEIIHVYRVTRYNR
jgi:hypothetical protein